MAKQPDRMVLCLAIGPAGEVYAGTGTTIWRWANAGESWTNTNPRDVQALAVDAAGAIYLGLGDRGGYPGTTGISGSFRSDAQGVTWTRGTLSPIGITSLVLSDGQFFVDTTTERSIAPRTRATR